MHILVAVTPGPRAVTLLRRAKALADARQATLAVLTITGLLMADEAQVEEVAALMQAAGIAGSPLARQGHPAATIAAVAQEQGAGLIIVGANARRNLRISLIGSTTERLLGTARMPILVLRQAEPGPDAIVAIKFTGICREAVQTVRALFPHAGLQLVHVADTPQGLDETLLLAGTPKAEILSVRRDLAARARADLAAFAQDVPDARQRVLLGTPDVVLTRLARARNVGLIALGTRGSSPLRDAFLGNVARKVIRNSVCDILVVPSEG